MTTLRTEIGSDRSVTAQPYSGSLNPIALLKNVLVLQLPSTTSLYIRLMILMKITSTLDLYPPILLKDVLILQLQAPQVGIYV